MLIRVPKIEPWRNFSVSLSLLLLTNMRFLEDRMFALKTGQGRENWGSCDKDGFTEAADCATNGGTWTDPVILFWM